MEKKDNKIEKLVEDNGPKKVEEKKVEKLDPFLGKYNLLRTFEFKNQSRLPYK